MTARPVHALPPQRPRYAAVILIAAVYVWFWLVAAHRIDEGPQYVGFAGIFTTNTGDFEHFWHAARAMRLGQDIHAAGAQGYIYPPLIAFLFMPLTLLSVQTAALIVLLINMGLALACTWLAATAMIRRFELDPSTASLLRVMAVTTLLSATRLRGELQMWQTNIAMLAAILLALRWLDARPWLAGILVALAINIKYLPLVLLPWLVLRRRFRAAAACLIGIVGIGMLPAVHTGLATNANQWLVATAGVARLLGFSVPAGGAANVQEITAGFSLSITSGLARVVGHAAGAQAAMLSVGAVAAVTTCCLIAIYVIWRKPVFAWPNSAQQVNAPFAGMIALEWAALIALALAFSPQTNARHCSMLLIVYAAFAAMLCNRRPGLSRWAAPVGAAVLFLGFALPPNTGGFAEARTWWARVGGQGWSMVAALPFLFIAGFDYVGAAPARRSRLASSSCAAAPSIGRA